MDCALFSWFSFGLREQVKSVPFYFLIKNKNMNKSEIVAQWRREYPNFPNLKLARIIYNDGKNNVLFPSVESIRSILRKLEGKNGKNVSKQFIEEFRRESDRPLNPYNLSKSDEDVFEPFIIKGHKRILILNDIHIPYHNIEALTACFNYAKRENPDAIFLNGDVLDFHGISYFLKDPRKKHFAEELEMFKDFISTLKKIFKCKIYFKMGNHEERYEHFLFQKAKELVGVEEFDIKSIIQSRAPEVEIITDKRIVMINSLPFVHGHEFGRGVFSPVNAARGLFLQAKHSCVKGDCHTTSEHTESDMLGNMMTTWSVGALCGLHPKWLPLNKWNHGFAIIDCDDNGRDYNFRNYRIRKGKVL